MFSAWTSNQGAMREAERFGAHRDAATSRSAVGFIRIPSSAPPRLRVNPSAILDRMTGFAGWTGGEERRGLDGNFFVGFIRVDSWFECLVLAHPGKAGCGTIRRS